MFRTRPGTCDANVYYDVVERNEYRLPPFFTPADSIIDIGCHIGSFSYAAWLRGSQNIIAFEPFPENYELAKENLAKQIERGDITLRQCAVWRSDTPQQTLFHTGSVRDGEELNTGAGSVYTDSGVEVQTYPLDKLLHKLKSTGKRVHLLKLDCEGSEFPILYSSRYLDVVDRIVLEYHEIINPPKIATSDDWYPFTIDGLIEYLRGEGFTCTDTFRHGTSRLGMAWFQR